MAAEMPETFRENLQRRFDELVGADRPAWYRAWAELPPDASPAEQLAVFQAIRRTGVLPEAASFWLVSYTIDEIAADEGEETLTPLESQLKAIEAAFRMADGGVWPDGASPNGYDQLRQEYYRAWDTVFIAKLEACGEREMARLFREDPDEFERLAEQGREYFHGPTDESGDVIWLQHLVRAVADVMEVDSPTGPLGCRYLKEDGHWLVDIYPTPVELVGGAVDGEVVVAGFTLSVEGLREAFDRLDELAWRPIPFPSEDEGPKLIVDGVFREQQVSLQILAYPPEGEEPGIKVNTLRPEEG